MNLPTISKNDIIDKLDQLPPETFPELRAFMEYLQFKSGGQASKQLIQLGDLWKDLPVLTEEDIAEARRELWSDFGERAL